jgi:hypothetical protein
MWLGFIFYQGNPGFWPTYYYSTVVAETALLYNEKSNFNVGITVITCQLSAAEYGAPSYLSVLAVRHPSSNTMAKNAFCIAII